MRKALFLFCLLVATRINAQGEIDHIKAQPYLEERYRVNCDSTAGDNLSARICANLAFQKSDSLLSSIYHNLLLKVDSNQRIVIVAMQNSWRQMRDKHCGLVYEKYKGGSGSFQAVAYLTCLKELTDNRSGELKKLSDEIGQ